MMAVNEGVDVIYSCNYEWVDAMVVSEWVEVMAVSEWVEVMTATG